MYQKPIRAQRGFTLIELMVTVAVMAIILGFAVPSFTDQIRNNRSLAYGDEFVTALNYTRSEAVKRGTPVSLCASNDDGSGCADDWTNGWLVFVDSDPGGETGESPTIDDPATDILRQWDSPGEGLVLSVERGGAVNFVRFNRMGALARIDDKPVTAEASHSDCTGNSVREIDIPLSGSVRSRKAEC